MFEELRNLKVYTIIRTAYMRPEKPGKHKFHWHDFYQFVYVRKGNGAVIIGGETFSVLENSALIVKCNEPHTFAAYSDVLETYEVKFSFLEQSKDFLKDAPRYFCRDNQGRIRSALRQIERESDCVDELSRDIISAEMSKILLLMQRESNRMRENAAIKISGDEEEISDELLEKIRGYIDANIRRNITVRDISDFVCVEYKYFSHHFARHYGMRLKQYIRKKRVDLAKELIVNSGMSMTEIAEQCGFGTIHYMARVFKNEENVSPTEFRNRFKKRYAVMLDKAPVSYYENGTVEG